MQNLHKQAIYCGDQLVSGKNNCIPFFSAGILNLFLKYTQNVAIGILDENGISVHFWSREMFVILQDTAELCPVEGAYSVFFSFC